MENSKLEAIKLARRYVGMDPVIYDTETTGLAPDAEICDIAIVDIDGQVLFESLIKPTVPINPKAAEITGISDATVASAPGILEVLPAIRKAMKGRAVGAYNADFDFRLLHNSVCAARKLAGSEYVELIEFGCVFDIISIGALYYGEWNSRFGSYKNKKLVEIASFCKVELDETLHRASADARVTVGVLKAIARDPALENVITVNAPFTASPTATVTVAEKIPGFQFTEIPARVVEIVRSNPYMLTRSDWDIIHATLKKALE